MQETHCRIFGIIARTANKVILFRRGPSTESQMLVWDFNNDEILSGQWLRAKIYTDRCRVSPDGEYVLIEAMDASEFGQSRHVEKLYHWLALSRPPYFSAIGLWPTDFYGRIERPSNRNNLKNVHLSQNALSVFQASNSQSIFLRSGFVMRTEKIKNYQVSQRAQVFDFDRVLHLDIVSGFNQPPWIDIDNSGRLVYADKGCLYAWKNFPEGKPTLIADLNTNKFENIPPPEWALKP